MLDLKKISLNTIHDQKWRQARLGKITASPFHKLMSEYSHNGRFDRGAITYIEELAGEVVTGEPAQEEFANYFTDHGIAEEPKAIYYFCEHADRLLGVSPELCKPKLALRNTTDGKTHRLIINDEYSACTPDALIAMYGDEKRWFDATGTKLKVYTLEVKCPKKHHRYVKLFKCKTPADLKAVFDCGKMYYYQVLAQMVFCDCLTGYFAAYNSKFKENPMKIIVFDAMELKDEITKIKDTLYHATQELIRNINLLKNAA